MEATQTYTVEVRGFDRISVMKVVAVSEDEAIEKAMEARNVRAKVLSVGGPGEPPVFDTDDEEWPSDRYVR